jgi:hypothetical protein
MTTPSAILCPLGQGNAELRHYGVLGSSTSAFNLSPKFAKKVLKIAHLSDASGADGLLT